MGYEYIDNNEEEPEELSVVREPVLEYQALDSGREYTYFDYLKFQFKERVELIRGKIFKMAPAPGTFHQRINTSLSGLFYPYFKSQPCKVFQAPFDVRLQVPGNKSPNTVVQPDLCVVCDTSKLDERGCNGSPDLVVEILSPGNSKHEMKTKFELYRDSGVKEYWIVQPEQLNVIIYQLKDGDYYGLKPFTDEDFIESPLFPDLELKVGDLFVG